MRILTENDEHYNKNDGTDKGPDVAIGPDSAEEAGQRLTRDSVSQAASKEAHEKEMPVSGLVRGWFACSSARRWGWAPVPSRQFYARGASASTPNRTAQSRVGKKESCVRAGDEDDEDGGGDGDSDGDDDGGEKKNRTVREPS